MLKYFNIDKVARIDQSMLNQIIVGRVFTVEDQISAKLDTNANM